MTKLSKVEFMKVVREMVAGKVPSVTCTVDAINNMIFKIAVNGQPYIDVNMGHFYFGYCLDTLTLSKIIDIVVKLAGGVKFSDDVLEDIVTRYEPKQQNASISSKTEESEEDEVSDEEFNADSYDVKLEEQQEKDDFKMVEKYKDVFLKHVYPKFINSQKMPIYRGCVHRDVLDMSLVYYVDIENPDYAGKTPFVNEAALKEFNVTEAELYVAAIENMLKNWEVIIIHEDAPSSGDNKTADCCFALTRQHTTNGASVILLPGLLKKISDVLKDNLYIIPFNKDTIMIHPVSISDLNLLKVSLSEFPGDVLSRNVIYYNRDTDNMSNV